MRNNNGGIPYLSPQHEPYSPKVLRAVSLRADGVPIRDAQSNDEKVSPFEDEKPQGVLLELFVNDGSRPRACARLDCNLLDIA